MERMGDPTADVGALLDEADREARAHGELPVQAWVRMGHAEIDLRTGEWDAAMRWGRAALDLAVPNAFHRVAVRTWFVVAPIAAYRGDVALLREMDAWLKARTDLPDSPDGRLMHAALDHLVAAGTGADPSIPDPERLLVAWALPETDAGFVAARDAVLRAWWDDGRFDALGAAVDAMPDDPAGAPLATAARRLWQARMGADEAEIVGRAREALGLARRWDAAWWIEQAIAILDDVGDATRDEREERRLIRLRLLGDP